MNLEEWKPKLIPAGALLVCYFAVPFAVALFMGANDTVFGEFSFSLAVQAVLGAALAWKLFGLKELLNEEMLAWLAGFSQPPEKTRELSEKISTAAILVFILSIIWPLAGALFGGGSLMTLLKVSVLAYAGYTGYRIWLLAEPFMAAGRTVKPVAEEPPLLDVPGPPAPENTRRCPRCGQLVVASMKSCAFCGHPLTRT